MGRSGPPDPPGRPERRTTQCGLRPRLAVTHTCTRTHTTRTRTRALRTEGGTDTLKGPDPTHGSRGPCTTPELPRGKTEGGSRGRPVNVPQVRVPSSGTDPTTRLPTLRHGGRVRKWKWKTRRRRQSPSTCVCALSTDPCLRLCGPSAPSVVHTMDRVYLPLLDRSAGTS